MAILAELKESTRELHQMMEGVMPVMRPDFDRQGYVHLLERLYGFYVPVEEKLSAVGGLQAVLPDLGLRMKRAKLREDLENLNQGNVTELPVCHDLPVLDSTGQALGCLYVLEGSTLGGQIISRHLKQSLGVDSENGARFFNSYSGDIGAMWKEFGARISEYAEAHDNGEILDSAKETFLKFYSWLAGEFTASRV